MRPQVNHQFDYHDYRQSYREMNNRPSVPFDNGFEIIQPSNNSWNQQSYDRAVKSQFRFTDQNWGEAQYAAAREGKPVLVVFGSRNTPDTQKLLEQTLPNALAGAGKDAVTVFVDMDRVDRNSALGKYVDQNIRSTGLAHTALFSLHPGQDGSPIPDAPLMTAWGGRGEIANLIQSHVGYGLNNMRQHAGRFRVPDAPRQSERKPDGQDGANDQAQPKEIAKRFDLVMQEMERGRGSTDRLEAVSHYRKAIEEADKTSPKWIETQRQQLDKQRKEAEKENPPNAQRLKELKETQLTLQHLQEAKSFTRANLGLSYLRWGMPQLGTAWLIEAGKRNPDMFDDPRFQKGLLQSGCPVERLDDFCGSLKGWTSEALKRNPNKDNQEQAESESSTELQKRADQTRRPQTQRLEKNVEDANQQDRPMKFPDLDSAMEASRRTGLPILIDVKSHDCTWCKKMDAESMPQLEKDYKGKMLIAEVYADDFPDVAAQLGVGAYPTTIMAAVQTGKDGKARLRPITSHEGYMRTSELKGMINGALPEAQKLMRIAEEERLRNAS